MVELRPRAEHPGRWIEPRPSARGHEPRPSGRGLNAPGERTDATRRALRRCNGMETVPALPVAYLITFHTYGTWLPGDPRGTVTRHHNLHGEPRRGASDAILERSQELLKNQPVLLEPHERAAV